MKKPERIIMHCSASKWGSALTINTWHLQRGWKAIGYHFVIGNGQPVPEMMQNATRWDSADGHIEFGRALDKDEFIEKDEVGAHAYGLNSTSIGNCLIGFGSKDFTRAQIRSAHKLVREQMKTFGIQIENILGHYEVDSKKPKCPGMNMASFRELLLYTPEQIYLKNVKEIVMELGNA